MASSIESDSTPTRRQLLKLKAVTQLSGTLHDAQLAHLRMWGLVVFQLVPKDGTVVKVDTDKRTVRYLLTGGKLYEKKKNGLNFDWLVQAIAKLDAAIHDLLGDDWQTIIEHNGKVEYTGPRQSEQEKINERRKHRSARTSRKR